MKLVPKGSVAIFCGTKLTASKICEKAVEYVNRGIQQTLPNEFPDFNEVKRLVYLHTENLGVEAPATLSSAYGIFSHHGNTPHGIRLAVEHAMREDLIKFVVCTSTLAQGVNLPIRYLIVSSIYQGKNRLKVRDFHNLIGRAGRSGIHTEGSIYLLTLKFHDSRNNWRYNWRWKEIKELLNPNNSEPCISNLLSLFEPIENEDGKEYIDTDSMAVVTTYIEGRDQIESFIDDIVNEYSESGFTRGKVESQVLWKLDLISSIENFLLSHWDDNQEGLSDPEIKQLAEGTLAYFLADDEKKELIMNTFILLGSNIRESITDSSRRQLFGRTLYGVQEAIRIEGMVNLNIKELSNVQNESDFISILWPFFMEYLQTTIFGKFDKPEVATELILKWISGEPYYNLLQILYDAEAKMIWGAKQKRDFKIDHVVELCENVLAYKGNLLIGAISEFIDARDIDESDRVLNLLHLFQKRLKLGLPSISTIGYL